MLNGKEFCPKKSNVRILAEEVHCQESKIDRSSESLDNGNLYEINIEEELNGSELFNESFFLINLKRDKNIKIGA